MYNGRDPKVVMRLKTSPKEALSKINELVLNGSVLLCSMESEAEYALGDQRKAKSRIKVSRPSSQLLKRFDGEYQAWDQAAEELLRHIFVDYVPIHVFTSSFWKVEPINNVAVEVADFRLIVDTLRLKLDILVNYYNGLADKMKNPLIYLPDRVQIWFYDFCCPLQTDSNEATLCHYIFGFSIGEKVEMEDIFAEGFGGNRDDYCGKDKAQIKHAYDGINRKTNDTFGFPILKKEGTTLCLTLPSRVTSNLT